MQSPFALICALALAACASHPKRPVEAARPVTRVVVAKYDERPITFAVAGAWAPLPSEKGTSNIIVLQHLDDRKSAISVSYDAADPGSLVEEQVVRWAQILLSGPMLYGVTDVSKPTIHSDEDASFTFAGEDAGVPMVSKFRVRLVSGHGGSYWVAIVSVTPMAARAAAFKEVDRIAESLKVHAASP